LLSTSAHSRASGNPEAACPEVLFWIPAFAGMTGRAQLFTCHGRTCSGHPRLFSQNQLSNRQASSPCFFAAPGTPSSIGRDPPARARTEGARDARGRKAHASSRRVRKQGCPDPRASTPRDIEACRSPDARLRLCGAATGQPQVRRTQGVPRAVFGGLLRAVPGGRPFVTWFRKPGRDTPPFEALATRPAMLLTARRLTSRQRGARRAAARRDHARLGPPGGKACAASPTPHSRPPLPAPRLETLIRHPSATRAG